MKYLSSTNQREGSIDQTKDDEFIFPTADGAAKLPVRDNEFREPTRRWEPTESGELQAEPKGPHPTETKDDAEARADFWSILGDFIYRHHNEPRVQLYVSKEETFRIPLKYIDVTGSTHADLDAMQEKRINDN